MKRVDVLLEPSGAWVVACFNDDCPDHGDGAHAEPWVDEFATKARAESCARQHRAEIKAYWSPSHCDKCGQRMPAQLTEPSEESHE